MKRSAQIVAAASVVWLGMAAWAIGTDSRTGEAAALVAGVVLLASVWWLLRAADRERLRWQHTLDAMQAGIVLYDADDRLVLTNAEFRRLYQLDDDSLSTRGMPFEELLRTRVLRGLVPEATGREEPWIAERVAQHRSGEGRTFLREMADSRWRRITEQRLPDGSRLGFSIDITELVENQRALDAARREAERAHQLMHDAIEAMPAAVEIYDRSDRLVLFNQRMLQLYPHMAGRTLLGETFDALVRNAVAHGKVPDALGCEERWLAERLERRGQSSAPRLQRAPSGAWYEIYETPMPRGGLVTVRLDATETVQQREELRIEAPAWSSAELRMIVVRLERGQYPRGSRKEKRGGCALERGQAVLQECGNRGREGDGGRRAGVRTVRRCGRARPRGRGGRLSRPMGCSNSSRPPTR